MMARDTFFIKNVVGKNNPVYQFAMEFGALPKKLSIILAKGIETRNPRIFGVKIGNDDLLVKTIAKSVQITLVVGIKLFLYEIYKINVHTKTLPLRAVDFNSQHVPKAFTRFSLVV
jgi:hypothetical protein